jgi:hypothetical protein
LFDFGRGGGQDDRRLAAVPFPPRSIDGCVMKSFSRRFPALVGLLAAAALAGCGDPYAGRVAVSGTVKLDGEPLKQGVVSFEPLDGQDTRSGAVVENGAFNVPREAGLKPGNYLVRVSAGDGVTPAEEPAEPGPGGTNIVSRDRVPPEWNLDSRHQEVVSKDGPNRFDFVISSGEGLKKR